MIARTVLVAGLLAIACHGKPKIDHFGDRFFSGGDGRRVVCSKGFDRGHEWTHDKLVHSLEHARDAGVVLQTFGHAPTIDLTEYTADFDWAAAYGVPMVTYRELATHHGAGWAFTIDDDEVDTWYSWRDYLRQHHVKVTFFVTRYDHLTPAQKQELHELVADGHDVEAHGVAHINAVDDVAARGVNEYIRTEVLPSRDRLAADGFATPIAFAYPYGAHTAAIDTALLGSFAMLRTTGAEWCLK